MGQETELLQKLRPGRFVSGQLLARELGVSRTAVWHAVRVLQSWGIRIDAIRGRGYCLRKALQLLDCNVIRAQWTAETRARISWLQCLGCVESTNQSVREAGRLAHDGVAVCLAEMQTQGRGRRGRRWQSPYAANLYLSLCSRMRLDYMNAGALGLHLCLAVAEWLKSNGVLHVGVKWPNDIYCNQQKLAGLLIEVSGVMDTEMEVIIGFGLNVDMRNTNCDGIDQPYTDIASNIETDPPDRSWLAGQLVQIFVQTIDAYNMRSLPPLPARWQTVDCLYGLPVRLTGDLQEVRGVADGVDEYGRLKIRCKEGSRFFTSGDVSVRRV